jgi:aspartate/methionine/tyrosine aminotransferase
VNMREKMNPYWADMQGGLFTRVKKSDVGSYYQDLAQSGVTMLAIADPFRPDNATPSSILKAAQQAALDSLACHYTTPLGNHNLKVEIAKKLNEYNKIEADPDRNIIITPGSDLGLYYAMAPFIYPGDEVLIPDPSYPNNYWNTKLLGGVSVFVPLEQNENWKLDVPEFEKRLSPKTKLVLLTHPNNPTTTVFRKQNIYEFCEFVISHDLVLVVDHAFEDLIYDGIEFICPASVKGMFDRTVSVFSVSKGFGLAGYRVGYIVASEYAMEVFYGSAVYVIGTANTVAQLAMIEGFRDKHAMDLFYSTFEARRKKVYEIVNSIPGVSMQMPESGILCWIDISKLGKSQEICDLLIEKARIATNAGHTYGVCGDGHIRIVFGSFRDEEVVYDALYRMKEVLSQRAREIGIK